MPRPTCAIDLDDVLARTHHVLYRLWRTLSDEPWLPTDYNPPGGFPEALNGELQRQFHAAIPMIPVIPGARTALGALSLRYRIVIVTARPESTRTATDTWLRAHRLPFEALYHTDVKGQIGEPLAFAVDDRPRHALEYAQHRVPCFLLAHAWNQDFPAQSHVIPALHWESILQHLSLGTQHPRAILQHSRARCPAMTPLLVRES